MLILETHRSGETGICRGASPSNRTIGVLEKNLAEFLGKIGVRVAGNHCKRAGCDSEAGRSTATGIAELEMQLRTGP
jgi:hypothetical protein